MTGQENTPAATTKSCGSSRWEQRSQKWIEKILSFKCQLRAHDDCDVVPGCNSFRLPSIKHESQNSSVIEPAMEVTGGVPVIIVDLVLPSFKRESKNVNVIEPAKEVAVWALDMASLNVGGECTASSLSECVASSLNAYDLDAEVVIV